MSRETQLINVLDLIDQQDNSTALLPLSQHDLDLQHMLTVSNIFSASNASAPAAPSAARPGQVKIGAGSCGGVFARDGEDEVVKLLKPCGFSLHNDFVMHQRILSSMKTHGDDDDIQINIPACFEFTPAQHAAETYLDQHPDLVAAAQDIVHPPTDMLVTQRIPALSQSTREELIDKFCVPYRREANLADPANRDCLVRVYLGSMAGKTGKGGLFFSLRNFKLHLNHIIDSQLDYTGVCVAMAWSLAVMHWAARTDARDVEFVLGGSDRAVDRPGTVLWLLDFNLVKDIQLDESCLEKLVVAHKVNDPYYPRPCQEHPVVRGLWNEFATAYVRTAAGVLSGEDEEVRGLPVRFLLALVEEEKAKQQKSKDA